MELTVEFPDHIPAESQYSRERYVQNLQQTKNYLDQKFGDDYRIVGGLARDAYLQKADFSTGTPDYPRDIDVLVIGEENRKKFEQVRKESPTDIPLGGFLNSYVKIDADNARLKTSGLTIEVPRKVFKKEIVNLNGIALPTLPAETLFHLYAIRGQMREKDFSSALSLGRFIKTAETVPHNNYPDELYTGFHEFSRRFRNGVLSPAQILEKAAQWYETTNIRQKLPLNDPRIRGVILHIWGIVTN